MRVRFYFLSLIACVMWGFPVFSAPGKNDQNSLLTVDIKIGTSMKNRDVVGVADKFSVQDKLLVGWTRIIGAQQPTDIVHIWRFEGDVKSKVTLPVRSSYYRTWSQKKLNDLAGQWVLEVHDDEGHLIGAEKFIVEEKTVKPTSTP